MLRSLVFFVLTLLAVDLAPSTTSNEGFVALLIASMPLLIVAANQRLLFRRPTRDIIIFSELFLFTLLFFYWVGIPHTFLAICCYLAVYFAVIGVGISWNVTLFLLPFALPFLLFFAASQWLSPLIGEQVFFALSILLLIAILLLLPLAFQWVWRCQPLPYSPLRDRLDYLCRRSQFHHGGILIWKVMQNATTAAIIGIFPRFRYILFTEPLLRTFPEEEVEAVLAHEIGHSVHKHLLIYPFLFLGLPAIGALISPWLDQKPPLFGYLIYAAILLLYVRVVIGFFSRNFERQADLHVFAFGLSAEPLSTALNRISYLNSLPLNQRNWHHGSLANRIAFLQKAEANPRLIKKHHRKVRFYLLIFLILNLSFWLCWIFLN